MADATPQPKSRVSPKAEEAFADYIALGPDRSYRALAALYVKQKRYKTETTAFNAISQWAGKYCWQQRIAEAATARSSAMLEEAAELDADTFLQSSRKLNASIRSEHEPETVIRIRESVRKPTAKGGTSVNVNVNLEVRQIVDRIAQEDGLTEDEKQELEDAIQRHLSGVR